MNRKRPQSLAVIDIGTNSIHMLIARRAAGDWRILQDEKDPSIGAPHFISDESMDRAVATVTRMCESARARNVEAIVAVATSAMRDASNRGDFLQRVRRASGVSVHVLSGAEESAYIYRAVRATIDLGHRRAVCIDLGGGSVELIVGTRDALEEPPPRLAAHRYAVPPARSSTR